MPNNRALRGAYVATAEQYQQGQTTPFAVAEGDDLDRGDFPLNSFPVRFSEIRPCGNLPPEGGECLYCVRVTNGLAAHFKGELWSLVESFGIGSFVDFTRFQSSAPQKLSLPPGAYGYPVSSA